MNKLGKPVKLGHIRIVLEGELDYLKNSIEPDDESNIECLLYGPDSEFYRDYDSDFFGRLYQRLNGMYSHQSPVYASRTKSGVAVLMFTGYRWAHIYGGSQYALGSDCVPSIIDGVVRDSNRTMEENNANVTSPNATLSSCKEYTDSFFPFTKGEKERIGILVSTVEWQLRSGKSSHDLPPWNTLVRESNCTTNSCASSIQGREGKKRRAFFDYTLLTAEYPPSPRVIKS